MYLARADLCIPSIPLLSSDCFVLDPDLFRREYCLGFVSAVWVLICLWSRWQWRRPEGLIQQCAGLVAFWIANGPFKVGRILVLLLAVCVSRDCQNSFWTTVKEPSPVGQDRKG